MSNQKGGNDVVPLITKTKTTPGTPFITNVAKEVFVNKKREEINKDDMRNVKVNTGASTSRDTHTTSKFNEDQGIPVTGPIKTKPIPPGTVMQPTFKMEMYNPIPDQQVPYGTYQPFIPEIRLPGTNKKFIPSAFDQIYAPTAAFSYGPNVKMPVQQVNYITLPGPTGDHVQMSKIYENVLPGKDHKFTSTTLGERIQIYDYVKQILIRVNDGEDISIDSDGQNNLLSYIKFMELNPNYYSPIFVNPYKGLPYGLLIYRSCFPIRMDGKSQSIICAKDSIGLNIRLYALSYAEYYSYKFRQVVYKEYDVWRELAYYEYVRENILKKKRSPNFTLLYAFFLSPNRKIDFFSLKKNCLTQKDMLTEQYQKFVQIHTLFSSVKPSTEIIRPMTLPDAARKVIAKLPDEIDPMLQAYSGTILILVTEAPHHNLYQWASRIYEKDGIVRKMISHGFHDENVWIGVLFQIISALYVMQLHGIYMRYMTIEDNIYIKDLQTYGKAAGYWIYVIDGISYYVPNYGYVVMIDSNFKDIVPSGKTIERCKREYKIYTSDIIGKRYSMASIRRKVFENYRNIINTNVFTKEHTQNNVMKPPEKIMNFIGSMMLDHEDNLGKVLSKHFRMLMHNRIGTFLKKDLEIPHIRETTTRLQYGELAIEVIEQDVYKWCLILESNDDGTVRIITRDTPTSSDFIDKTVRIETIKQFSSSEKIEQTSSADVNLSEEQLLETYILN